MDINFRAIVPIFLFSICCPFDLLSGHQEADQFIALSNYISPVGLFHVIFRLTDFSSDPFDFSSSKMG